MRVSLEEYQAIRQRMGLSPEQPQATAAAAKPKGKTFGDSSRSRITDTLFAQLEARGLTPLREFHMANIDPGARGFRFDFAFVDERVLIELHGAVGLGHHSRKKGQTDDLEKCNLATEHGYAVFSYSAAMVNTEYAANQIERVIRARRRPPPDRDVAAIVRAELQGTLSTATEI